MADSTDILSKLGDLLMPGGGLAVGVSGFLGGWAAKDKSLPRVEQDRSNCAPGDFSLGCGETTVSPGDPESALASWVPDWWVEMGAAAGGFVAALVVLGLLALVAAGRVADARGAG